MQVFLVSESGLVSEFISKSINRWRHMSWSRHITSVLVSSWVRMPVQPEGTPGSSRSHRSVPCKQQ